MSVTFDLNSLGLPEGSYTATVRARGANTQASEDSNGVNYVVSSIYPPRIYGDDTTGSILHIEDDTRNGDTVQSFKLYKQAGDVFVNSFPKTGQITTVPSENDVDVYAIACAEDGAESARSNVSHAECFPAGTPVLMMDGSYKLIEEIQPYDMIMSYDDLLKTYVPGKVTSIVVGNTQRMAMLQFDNSCYLAMSEGHPLYTKDGWHSITNKNGYPTLKIGDEVLMFTGYAKILDLQVVDTELVPVYSLTVDVGYGDGAPYFAGHFGAMASHGGGSN